MDVPRAHPVVEGSKTPNAKRDEEEPRTKKESPEYLVQNPSTNQNNRGIDTSGSSPAVKPDQGGEVSTSGANTIVREVANKGSRRRSPSVETIKPNYAADAHPQESTDATKSGTDLAQASSSAAAKNSQQHSDSTGSSSNIWLSPPTSRIPSSKDSSASRLRESGSVSQASFVTADEGAGSTPPRLDSVAEVETGSASSSLDDKTIQQSSSPRPGLTAATPTSSRGSSDASLIQHNQPDGTNEEPAQISFQTKSSHSEMRPSSVSHEEGPASPGVTEPVDRVRSGLVRFEQSREGEQRRRQMKFRVAQMRKRDTFKRMRRDTVHNGEIVKIENMLVRLEFTLHKVPDDFNENDSEKIETTVVERWKEFMCVCRESDDEESPFLLQLYKSRVIPAIERTHVKRRWTHEIQLRRSNCHVNLYSSLDKSMVIWFPCKQGNMVYTIQSRCGANSMEWYTFIRNILGLNRPSLLRVNIPDLSLNLRINKPFEALESVRNVAQAADGDEQAIMRTMKEEQAATARIIERCMKMLSDTPDWKPVLEHWKGSQRMGLAWKRYDRLEWVHGANERKMYGTIAMEKTHELELRPKQHYPTSVREKKPDVLTEPPAVEGFLIRLTSQKGVDQKLGKLFFKRLYFSTHNQFLVFSRPVHADPPPPPRLPMTDDAHIPSAQQIAEKTPLIYEVSPYPLQQNSQIEWLHSADPLPQQLHKHDQDAFDENHRRLNLLRHCDGLVNLCNVTRVRNLERGATPADNRVDSGSDVDFDQSVPNTTQDDGTTQDMDDSRIFELVLRNGLVVRLQAFNHVTKNEWMTRLRALIRYWRARTRADVSLYKSVRAQNLDRLKIDEQSEAYVGQFADKWEVLGSYASPDLYNMCGIACCRSLHMSGELYHKARMHGTFRRMLCLLSHGRLLMFADALRGRDGRVLKHIHHEHISTLDLHECYIYSGLAATGDLMYSGSGNQYDRNRAGRHGLPRLWADDGWSSIDEDTSTCFVIWHGKKSGWFRSQDDVEVQGEGEGVESGWAIQRSQSGETVSRREKSKQRLRRVRKLGTEGKSMVFRARSRAERDHWVLSIGMEIERVQEGEEVRVVGEGRSK